MHILRPNPDLLNKKFSGWGVGQLEQTAKWVLTALFVILMYAEVLRTTALDFTTWPELRSFTTFHAMQKH